MIRAAVGISADRSAKAAAETAAMGALAEGLRPDSALVFVEAGFAECLPEILDVVIGCLGTDALVGATAHGVMGGGREIENTPSIAVIAQSGLEAYPFLVADLAGDEAAAGAQIAGGLADPPRPEDVVVLLPDPAGVQLDPLLDGIRRAFEPAVVVGAAAAAPTGNAPLQWCGRQLARGGAAGMVLRGPRPPRIGVTQACRPTTDLMRVTRTQGHWILGLDDRPALDVYREVARGPLAEDLRNAARFLLVAVPRDERRPLQPGGYIVRHVIGFAEKEKAFAIPEDVKPGDAIALAVRDPGAAREDLKAMLEPVDGSSAALGLYFNCCARGSDFFGVDGLEAAYLERALGQTPLAGMFGSCEIGPIAGRPELLTYTGVLALFDS